MDSVDLEVLRKSVDWLQGGRRVLLATVIKTWGSSPRPVGALAAIREDSLIVGSVSGGCVEDDLVRRNNEARPTLPARVTYGVTAEQARRFHLPCGGVLEVLLEPAPDVEVLRQVLGAIERRERVAREVQLTSGRTRVVDSIPKSKVRDSGDTITIAHGPTWRMIIIGAAQSSRFLAEMATALDYQVTVCDPRREYADAWEVPATRLDRRMPDDAVVAAAPDQQTAIIALSHDPRLDDMALLEALRSDAFYVGAMGSKSTNGVRRERLAVLGLTEAEIAKLYGPVGLAIGSRTPAEIAVATLAELTALRNGIVLSASADSKRVAAPSQVLCG